jgi:molecular chaperone GrpE
MENLRKRSARELEDARRYAITGFARDLLEVSDNLGRAVAHIPPEIREQEAWASNLATGVEMTEKALLSVFEKHDIRRIEPEKGEKFDHQRHQAMFEVPTDAHPPGTVAEVMATGYAIGERLLRPAMVGVAKAPQPAAESSSIDQTA